MCLWEFFRVLSPIIMIPDLFEIEGKVFLSWSKLQLQYKLYTNYFLASELSYKTMQVLEF